MTIRLPSDRRLEPVATGTQALRRRAEALFPGGVNSPVRSYRAVGGDPPIIARGEGARVWDVDGREYIDYVGGFGPMILGHAHPDVVRSAANAMASGGPFGATVPGEIELAERIAAAVPSMQRMRFVSSGTEAVMSALRLARAATGRSLVVKFHGAYHGHVDSLLAKAGSGLATLGMPASAGVPRAVAEETLLVPYNDAHAVEVTLHAHPGAVAAVIVEPVAANMGVVPPLAGFLEHLREITLRQGALLIFDEVITGFRVARGGAQALFGVEPDLTILGKVIGGGMPIGAYGGRADLMDLIAPQGAVYQAGTLSGHPVAMAAGAATLDRLMPELYARLEASAASLAEGLRSAVAAAGAAVSVARVGSLLTMFWSPVPPGDFEAVQRCDTAGFAEFHRRMRSAGILLPPSQQEAWFVSAAHTPEEIERSARAAAEALRP